MDSERPPVAAAALVTASGGIWGSALLVEGELLAGIGAWLVTLVAITGLLVARSRWAVRLSLAVAALAVPGVLVLNQPVLEVVGVLASVLAVWVVLGAATAAAVRPFRAADAPPDEAGVLMLLLVSAPLVLGLATLGAEPPVVTIAVGLAAPVLAWWFGRRSAIALWIARVVAPVALLGSAVVEGWPRGFAAAALACAVGWFAWQPAVRLAAVPLAPTKSDAKPVVAEFAPVEVREAAGLDERGRR